MSHIFISYSRKDIDFAQKIVDALASNKLDTWIDWKSIPKGEDWEQEIYRGIEEADAFLFLISADSVSSEMCNKEIVHAVKNGKRILPIVIRDTDAKIIHSEISKRNWIFCRARQDDFNKAIEETHRTIHTDYEWLKYHTELQVKALKWEQKKDNSRLLRGQELREAEQQLAGINTQEDPQPTTLQREYVLTSQRSEVRQRRQVTIGLGAGLAIVAVLAVFAWVQRNTAVTEANSRATAESNAILEANAKATALVNEENARATAQANEAEAVSQRAIAVSRALAVNASNVLGTDDGSLSLLLAMEAVRATYSLNQSVTPEAENILRRAIADSPWRKTLVGNIGSIISFDGHEAVAYDNTTIRLWNIETGKQTVLLKAHIEGEEAVAFSGGFLAVASDDGIVRLWNVDTLREVMVFHGHTKTVNAIAFSPDDDFLATASSDTTVRLWNVKTNRLIAVFRGHSDRVNGLAFSPDGKLLATASDDKTVIVWDIGSMREVAILQNPGLQPCPNGNGQKLIFRPDGKFLVATGSGCGAILWNTGPWQEIKTGGHRWPTHKVPCPIKGDAVFYEQTILTTGCDGVIRSWNVETGELIEIIGNLYQSGYEKLNYGDYWEINVAMPPNTLLAATIPGGAMLWARDYTDEAETPWKDHMVLMGHKGQVTSTLILDDKVITAGEDGTIRFWNISKDVALTEANNPESSIEELMALAQQRVQRNPPQLTCEERVEYLKEKLDCVMSTATP